MFEDSQEAVDFWEGTLTDVKETKNLIPPSRNVKLLIKDVDVYSVYDDGSKRNWRQLRPSFTLADGVDVGGEIKYKGMSVSSMMPYFAEPTKKQYLVPLVQLVRATQVDSPSMSPGGLSDESAVKLAEELKGKMVLGSILQTKKTSKNPETGKYEPVVPEELQNEVKNFKAVPESELV